MMEDVMKAWDGLLEGYLRQCETRGLSPATAFGRRRELEKWGAWCKRRRPALKLEEINSEEILGYLKGRTAFHAKATLHAVISHLRNMGEYLVQEGYWRQNPLRWIRGPKLNPRAHVPRRVGKEEMKKIWEEAGKLKSGYQRHLWVTVLAALYGTGIRRGELARLKVQDWNRETGLLRVDGRKTGQEREVPVPEVVWGCLEGYLPRRHNLLERAGRMEETALFVGQGGKALAGERIGTMIHKLAHRANVGIVSVHQFRHTCASDLIEGGAGLAQVQQILGHASLQSTCRYIQVSAPERKEAMALHPINAMLGGEVKEKGVLYA
jgi:site-specific recombinase XerD